MLLLATILKKTLGLSRMSLAAISTTAFPRTGLSGNPLAYAPAEFCILIQGVDNPDQAPLRPAPVPQNQP